MQSRSSSAISLLPASEDDIPSLIRIHTAGFSQDNSVRLMFKSEDEYETMLLGLLKAQLSSPEVAVIKAVGKDTGNVLGWQACRFLDKDDDWASREAIEKETSSPEGNVRTLRSVLHENSVKVQKRWMANRKYIHFNTLVVDPAAQGHGVGTALVRWVTNKADADGLYCWLLSSPVAHDIYLKAVFKDVDSFEVDLREFAPGGKEGKWGWGMFEFKYMLRLPES